MKEERHGEKMYYLTCGFAVAGMIIGCLVYLGDVLFYHAGYFRHSLDIYSTDVVKNLSVNQIAVCILKRRSQQLFLFVLGAMFASCGIVTGIYCMIFGVYYGVTACSLLVQYGIKGMGYCLACFFPHYLFYLLAMYFFGKWYGEKQEGKYKYYPNINFFQSFVKFIVIFLLIFFSLVWEIKFQKNILIFFYQYLVS